MATEILTSVEHSLHGQIPQEAFDGQLPVTVELSVIQFAGTRVAQSLLATIDLRVADDIAERSVKVSGKTDDGRSFAGRLHRDDPGRSFLNVTTVETVPRPKPV